MVKKIVISVGILFVLGLALTGYYLFRNAEQIANEIVRNEFLNKYNKSNSSQYFIEVDDIELNILTGSFELQGIRVSPKDSLIVFERNIDRKSISNTTFHITIDQIALAGFDIMEALNNRFISAQKFEVINPKIDIYQYKDLDTVEENDQDTIDLRSLFLTNYDSFNLEQLSLIDITTTLHVIDSLNDTSTLFSIHNLNHNMFKVTADKGTLYSKNIFEVDCYNLNSEDIEVDLGSIATLTLSSINFDSKNHNLEISDFQFKPNISPAEFLNKLKYKKGWVDFKASKINFTQIDVEHWFHENEFIAQNLTVVNPELNVFNKEEIPFDPNENKPMLGQMIHSIPLPILIENTTIKNATINVDIDGKMVEKHGKLSFHNMNIEGKNVSNIEDHLAENGKMILDVKTQLNNTGKINAHLQVDLASKSSVTLFNVNAGKIDFPNFNSVLKPILRVSLVDGTMVSLKINSTLSTHGAFGTMDAHYTGLKLQLEGKDIDKKPGFFNNVASGLANGLLRTENNPNNQYYHQGKFRFAKTKHDNFFKMLWLVTMHGLTDSILGSDYKDEKEKRKKERKSKPKKKLFNF